MIVKDSEKAPATEKQIRIQEIQTYGETIEK